MSSFGSIDNVVNKAGVFSAKPFTGEALHVLAELCDRRWPSDYRTQSRIVQRHRSSACEATRAKSHVGFLCLRAFDISTEELAANTQSGGQFFGVPVSNAGRIMIFAGGIPVKRGRKVVGTIGVGGGSGEQEITWPAGVTFVAALLANVDASRVFHRK